MKKKICLLAIVLFAVGCSKAPSTAPPGAPAHIESASLVAADGSSRTFRGVASGAPYSVMVFIAADCPCLNAHLGRLRALHASYAPKGVQFVAVDSEVGASSERAASQARALSLPFPILVDGGAKIANALGAEYATYTVIVDQEGRVLYRGGIDSDKRRLHADATPYVADALEDLLASREPRRREGKALGCSLRKW